MPFGVGTAADPVLVVANEDLRGASRLMRPGDGGERRAAPMIDVVRGTDASEDTVLINDAVARHHGLRRSPAVFGYRVFSEACAVTGWLRSRTAIVARAGQLWCLNAPFAR